MRSYLLALLIVVPAYAQNQCDQVQSSLTSLEQSLLAKQLPACDQVTPASVGLSETLTGDDLEYFDFMRCQNIASLDLLLSANESNLVIIDGLNDLRTQVVVTQRTLASDANWDKPEKESALQFARDLTLGSTIQGLIDLPQLPALFDDTTSTGQWEAKLRTFCSAAPQSLSPFCAMVTTYSSGASPALQMSEFAVFLDQLRPALQPNKTLTDDQKRDMLATLQLKNGAQSVSFSDFQEQAAQNGLYNFTLPGAPTYLDQAQVNFVRKNRLSVPPAPVALLEGLMSRMNTNQDKLILKNALNGLRKRSDDAHERTLARIRARWTSLHLHKGGAAPIPCVESASEAAFKSCIETEWAAKPSSNNAQAALFAAIRNSIDDIREKRSATAACLAKPNITAWLQNPTTPPDSCVEDVFGERSQLEKTRQITLAIREKLRAQEDRALRFRRFAYDKAAECVQSQQFKMRTHEALPYCSTTPSESAFAPILELGAQSLSFVHEGLESNTVFDKNRDCPPGQQDEYAVLCEIAHGRGASSNTGTVSEYRGTPQTLGTDAPTRSSDPLIRDALLGVANDLANQYIQNRMQAAQPQVYRWPQSPYRPMPYSQPISLSMSDFVIANGKTFGGFGQYYQCATCGHGSGPTAFNQRWGLGGASSAVSTLGGTSLSSRLFPAGSFQF